MSMKMIIAILDDKDTQRVTSELAQSGYTVTKIDSTGGFLRRGNSTLIIGVEKHKIDEAIDIINYACEPAVNPLKRRATIMVLDVEHFEQWS